MKKQKILIAFGAFFGSLFAFLAISNTSAFAATKTWDGDGADNNFSTATNWDSDTAPASGDSIELPLDVLFANCDEITDVTLTNDLVTVDTVIAGLSLTGNKPDNCYDSLYLDGNEMRLSDDFGTIDKYINVDVKLTATSNIAINSVISTGGLAIGANNVTLNKIRVGGSVTGSGVITVNDYATYRGGGDCSEQVTPSPFSGDGSGFTGSIILGGDASLIITERTTDIARSASSISLTGTEASLYFATDYQQTLTFNKTINIAGGYISTNQSIDADCNESTSRSNVELGGTITFSGSTKVYLNNANLIFKGTVNGKDYIKLQDGQNGTITYADGSKVESALKIVTITDTADCGSKMSQAGNTVNTKLIVNVDCSTATALNYITAQDPYEVRGILAGTGKMTHVKIMNGGILAPGLSPGTLSVLSIVWEAGGIYEFEIGKDAVDQIKVTGTVDLGNGTLTPILYDGYKPKAGSTYVIIDNDGTDAVTGTFKDLAEGATFKVDGYVYKISYKGGDGNDVTLTVVSVPSIPDTGFMLMKNNPIATLAVTTLAAGSIVYMSRRMKPATKRVRR